MVSLAVRTARGQALPCEQLVVKPCRANSSWSAPERTDLPSDHTPPLSHTVLSGLLYCHTPPPPTHPPTTHTHTSFKPHRPLWPSLLLPPPPPAPQHTHTHTHTQHTHTHTTHTHTHHTHTPSSGGLAKLPAITDPALQSQEQFPGAAEPRPSVQL